MLEVVLVNLTVLVNISLGLWIFLRNPRSATNQLFIVLTSVFAVWTVFNYFSLHSSTAPETLTWIRVILFLAAFKPPLLFLLFHTFPNEKVTLRKSYLLPLIAFSTLSAFLALSSFVFTSVIYVNGNPQPVPSFGLPLWAGTFFVILISSFVLLIRRIRKEEGLIKTQMEFLLIGFVLSFSFFLVTNFIMVNIFENSSLVSVGPLFTVIMAGFIAYAIVKLRLFNIKVVTTEVFTLVLWIILAARLFGSRDIGELVTNSFILISVTVAGFLLIRSIRLEIKQREELARLNEKLKELDQRKNEFLNVAAHELRAPMTAIKGYVSMLLDGDAGKLPPKAREFLDDTSNVTDRLVRLVNNMLNVSRIEENRMIFKIDKVHLSEVVKDVTNEFKIDADSKKLKLAVNVWPDIKDIVSVDPDRIHEVVANLVSNAIKYTDQGSVEVILRNPDENHVRMEVIDTGLGISKEEEYKLFQKFSRAESAIGKAVGTGLGLYISKLLIEKFGGQIGFTSEVGKRSTFWFELPVVQII